jgi:Subtilase family
MNTNTISMTAMLLAVASNIALAQDQAKMQALHAQVSAQEPQAYTNAQQQLQVGQGTPEFIDYTLLGGGVLAGQDGGTPFFIHSHNAVAADSISTDELRSTGLLRLGLTGVGTTLGMWEISDPLLTHAEFTNGGATVRVIDADGTNTAGANPIADRWHATHVAGTLVARGANPLALGMSPSATLRAYDTFNQFTDMTGIFSNATTTDDIAVSNHSYGRVAGWWTTYTHTNGLTYPVWNGDIGVSAVEDYAFGYYDGTARQLDQITYIQQTYLPVWSAGNDRLETNAVTQGTFYVALNGASYTFVNGPYPAADGVPAGFDSVPGYGTAKNVLTVAAANDIVGGWTSPASVTFAAFSGAGPTDDGRIKPEVTANGVGVLSSDDPSTSPFNTTQQYFSYNGTSMASPNVAGSINLLAEYHTRLWGSGSVPWASTVKGWVVHNADEAGATAGPDYRGGYGNMNTMRAASFIRANKEAMGSPFIKQAQVNNAGTWTLTVTAVGGQPLKVTVPWTDPAATVHTPAVDNAAQKLINDLDVRVTGPGAVVTMPWILDPANPANAATRGDNSRDNLEQVVVDNPTAGATYTITVAPSVGETLVNETGASAPQNFSVLISGIIAQHEASIPITITKTGATNYELSWAPLPGTKYNFETSTDLVSWTTLQSNLTFAITPNFTNVTTVAAEPRRFWRFKVAP